MANKLIRDIPDETMREIEAQAHASGKNAEAWIRNTLIRVASGPIVKERYAIHFSTVDNSGAQGMICRFIDIASLSAVSLTQEQDACAEQAKRLIQRNGPGDREEAFSVLRTHFRNVFEMPV